MEDADLDASIISPNLFHVIMGTYVFLLLILLCWIFPYLFLGFTLVSLSVFFFDVLFVFLVFPLRGPLYLKILLLIGGNMVGFFWEYFFASLATNGSYYFGDSFLSIYFVASPFLELFWVVSIWAVGLSVLATTGKTQRRRG